MDERAACGRPAQQASRKGGGLQLAPQETRARCQRPQAQRRKRCVCACWGSSPRGGDASLGACIPARPLNTPGRRPLNSPIVVNTKPYTKAGPSLPKLRVGPPSSGRHAAGAAQGASRPCLGAHTPHTTPTQGGRQEEQPAETTAHRMVHQLLLRRWVLLFGGTGGC